MSKAHAQGGWTVSEVEQLTGLPRRDIQRCCYQGKGGVGILSPQDSAWGKRTYSTHDLATLFVVQLEKQEGLSLPEIAKKLHEQPVFEPAAKTGALPVYTARLAERQEEIAGQLLAAQALLLAIRGEGARALAQLVEHEVDRQLAEAFRSTTPSVDEAGGTNPNHLVEDGKQSGHHTEHGWLIRNLAELEGQAAHSPKTARKHTTVALAGAIDSVHECYGVSHVAAKEALSWALDAPGMPLAIELWLGPATHKLLMQALR